MAALAPGNRLKSAVCATEIMVITAPDGEVDLRCGGTAMTQNGDRDGKVVDPAHAKGSVIGKRYVNGDGSLEVLCVKAGDGSLAVGDEALAVKDVKKLPNTD